MKRLLSWGVLGILLLGGAAASAETSLSDLNTESLSREISATGMRNPFAPTNMSGEIEIGNLNLEGSLIGAHLKLALVSGYILQEGSLLGAYTVSSIKRGEIRFTDEVQEYTIKMAGYTEPIRKKSGRNYAIEFRQAALRDTLSFLAKAAGYNLIVPEDTQGRVSLSFGDTTILNAMKSILRVNNYSYAMENSIMRVGKPDDFKGGTDLLSVTYPLKFATAKDLEDKIKAFLSDKGTVIAEERSNVLNIKDYDANIDKIRKFLDTIDKKDKQILIEAHIVDATNDFSRSLGVQWGASGTPSNLIIAGGDKTGTITVGSKAATPTHVNLPASSPTGAAMFRIASLPASSFIDVQLTAAEEKGEINIISKPSVITVNNKPAQIRSGVTLYVKSNSDINVGTTGSSSSASTSDIQAIETGIQLDVTPQVTADRLIKLIIEANESEADFSRTVDGIPAILDNTATTTVILADGETAVIGGLLKRKDTLTHKGVPGLSKIPLIGLLFKSKTKQKTNNELMVFITPHILK